MKAFSVMVLLYNSEREAVCRTLDSILCQRGVDYELILADDGSANHCLQEAEEYLAEKKYKPYKVKAHPENVGTVQNIYDAMECAEGKYVKCIGAGDLLFQETTLKEVYDYMEDTACTMCFGKMQAYRISRGAVQEFPLFCPADIAAFRKKKLKRIQKNIIQNHGWIAGASMFYDAAKFHGYLETLLGRVRYCEDLLQVVLLLQNDKIGYLEKGLIYYEVGSGISTNAGNGNSARMQKDHEGFWNMITEKYADNILLKQGQRMYQYECIADRRKRQLQIIRHNPGYVAMMLRTILQKKNYAVEGLGMLREMEKQKKA